MAQNDDGLSKAGWKITSSNRILIPLSRSHLSPSSLKTFAWYSLHIATRSSGWKKDSHWKRYNYTMCPRKMSFSEIGYLITKGHFFWYTIPIFIHSFLDLSTTKASTLQTTSAQKSWELVSLLKLDTQNHAKIPRLLSLYLYLNVQQVLKRIAGSKMQLFTEENKEWFPNKHHGKASWAQSMVSCMIKY